MSKWNGPPHEPPTKHGLYTKKSIALTKQTMNEMGEVRNGYRYLDTDNRNGNVKDSYKIIYYVGVDDVTPHKNNHN